MSTYGLNYSDGDRHIAYSFQVKEEATPEDVYDQFVHFLNSVYGWDVREFLNENITA
jgi:hypothetical protein